MKKYKLKYRKKIIITIFFLSVLCPLIFSTVCFCVAQPQIVKKLNTAFENIRDWMIKLATPAAAVAVGTGIFITKFSFGDDDKIMKGKRLVRTSLYSYGFIIAVELILKAIDSLL
ncbi:MAG: hypothetical protein E7311_05215 [Clostridiales bacterium]|nr:hypothetical protein [Clostridiales bacterium]